MVWNSANNVVLNLIINGIPSIPYATSAVVIGGDSFKPYYKWNTFNTIKLVYLKL